MPLKIVRNDITKMETDAVVNTANPRPQVGDGVDSRIYEAAGFEQSCLQNGKKSALSGEEMQRRHRDSTCLQST